jgi:deoxyribodipyrimidine photo-lyase
MRTLVWFRGKDLRLSDHGPLRDALASGEVIPVFVVDPFFFAPSRAQELPHRIQFLLESLEALATHIQQLGCRLLLAEGRSVDVIPLLAQQWKVDRVAAHRWSEPFGIERDRIIASTLDRAGIQLKLYEGETLVPPGSILNQSGAMYGVFTPFSRTFQRDAAIAMPFPAPKSLPPIPKDVKLAEALMPSLESMGIRHNPRLQPGGEKAGRTRMKSFLDSHLANYGEARNRMDLDGSSRLSADLKFGTVSIRTLWRAVAERETNGTPSYLNELVWREFAHHLLWHRPDLLEKPFRLDFQGFPWCEEEKEWELWRTGRSGYPVVDAAARQLLATGFVHNRARMITASFLTKHLLQNYRRGEAHFMKWLTDGDWAANNAGWQWSAGCGCDAQPWFRIFNPILQGKKFDPHGDYVRTWVPELSTLGDEWIHTPWNAPESIRRKLEYTQPMVDLSYARQRFLAVAKSHLRKLDAF